MIMKILSVIGTRPEAIKMAPLLSSMMLDSEIKLTICSTGQHRHMLDQVLSLFKISPDIDLNIMLPGQDLFDVTSAVLLGLRRVLLDHSPDLVLVHGDTSTAMTAAMASFYMGVPVGHVEAGLRTNNLRAPFPEEFNRQVISRIAQLHFCPTMLSRKNLINEGVVDDLIHITGNTGIDSLMWVLNAIKNDPNRHKLLSSQLNSLLKFNISDKKIVLITGHRRENFGDGFASICSALKTLALKFPEIYFIYPVHLNPNVRVVVHEVLGGIENIALIPPLEYELFVFLMSHAKIIITDSGGIQEEAPSLGIPVLVTRDVTERPEAIEAGVARLVGSNEVEIIKNVSNLLAQNLMDDGLKGLINPYGDGLASPRILKIIKEFPVNGLGVA